LVQQQLPFFLPFVSPGDIGATIPMMRGSYKVYAVAAGILIFSFVAAWMLPTTEIFRAILSIPGASAIVVALYQFVRDQAAHERALDLQEKQQLFNLGVTSHMANVAFDRHVQFSEKYISTMQEGLTELFRTGPPGESLKFCQTLIDIRLSFRAWIIEDIAAKVMPFEAALRKMGAHKIVLEGIPPGPERTRLVTEISNLFSDVTGIERGGPVDENLAAGRIMSHLQDLLEVQQLSRLWRAVVQVAIDALERKAYAAK
jgi:hypothetical protein